uniref:Leucine-rich repeat-containing N-terminal plant-type domain-containing protein n=1 Tax=Leersia perrieri TaxID=77586 RepID=A0A0D9XT92_9ORYZ
MLPNRFCTAFKSVVYLDLSNNRITCVLPNNMSTMQLDALYLSSNQLTGRLPLLPRLLRKLDLSQNSFSGPLPTEFGAPGIFELILSSNYFTGHITESICELHDLLALDLSHNLLEGELPECFHMQNVSFLFLSNNKLSGKFPPSLQTCPSLAFLDLAWNKFFGSLPVWIGDLVYLRFLQLSHNKFSGDIPVNITNLKRLRMLNLASNGITGTIPPSLSNLPAMAQKHPRRSGINMHLWYTGLIGNFREVLSVVMKRQELKYGAGIFDMVSIDLSINHLTGRIPSGRQLDTLYTDNPTMYNGNYDLCGPPLHKNCSINISDIEHGHEKKSVNYSDPMFFYFGLLSGFVVGLWVVLCALLFKQSWRVSYFRLFDKLCLLIKTPRFSDPRIKPID